MPPFLGHRCWYSFNDKDFLPRCQGHTDSLCTWWSGFFETLKECIPCLMFFVLIRYNTAENHASLEQFPRVIWESVSLAIVLSLAQIKLFSIPITDCLLIISINIAWHSWQDIRKTHLRLPGVYAGPAPWYQAQPLEPHWLHRTLQVLWWVFPDI